MTSYLNSAKVLSLGYHRLDYLPKDEMLAAIEITLYPTTTDGSKSVCISYCVPDPNDKVCCQEERQRYRDRMTEWIKTMPDRMMPELQAQTRWLTLSDYNNIKTFK